MGDRFVIEVDSVFAKKGGSFLYGIKGFEALVFDGYGLEQLEKEKEKPGCDDSGYLKGYLEGCKNTYTVVNEWKEGTEQSLKAMIKGW